jgi:hypothetical protein
VDDIRVTGNYSTRKASSVRFNGAPVVFVGVFRPHGVFFAPLPMGPATFGWDPFL